MGKAQPKNWLVGRWLIESMEHWRRDFNDAEVRGYFEFDAKGSGEFQFGYVHGYIDYRLGERDGKPAVEYTWDGNDEMAKALCGLPRRVLRSNKMIEAEANGRKSPSVEELRATS